MFAVDNWARDNGCTVLDPPHIKYVSGALLRGETVGVRSDFPVDGRLPAHISLDADAESGFVIGFDTKAAPFAHTLHLVPRIVYVGIGCRRGTDAEKIETAVREALAAAGVPPTAVCGAASIDIKKDEPGLLLFCQTHGLALTTFSAEALRQAAGDFTPSAFVAETVGVDNVCERAAVCAAGGGRLLCHKTARDGVTVALAARDFRVRLRDKRIIGGLLLWSCV